MNRFFSAHAQLIITWPASQIFRVNSLTDQLLIGTSQWLLIGCVILAFRLLRNRSQSKASDTPELDAKH